MNGFTAFHRYVEANAESLLDVLWEMDQPGAKIATDNLAFADSSSCQTPLQLAVQNGNTALILKLLDHGAVSHIDFESWYASFLFPPFSLLPPPCPLTSSSRHTHRIRCSFMLYQQHRD